VSDPAESLPNDIDALRVLVRSALVERDAARAERDHAVEQIDRLRHLLKELQRARFGRRSERLGRATYFGRGREFQVKWRAARDEPPCSEPHSLDLHRLLGNFSAAIWI
jgi:hypothetical protein